MVLKIALHAWCCHNSLSLNPNKSDPVLFGTWQRSHSFSDVTTVNVAGSVVPMADHDRLVDVTLNNRLSMNKHVNEVSRICFYHLRALRNIRPAITVSEANVAHHLTLFVFNASKMRWLDAF